MKAYEIYFYDEITGTKDILYVMAENEKAAWAAFEDYTKAHGLYDTQQALGVMVLPVEQQSCGQMMAVNRK